MPNREAEFAVFKRSNEKSNVHERLMEFAIEGSCINDIIRCDGLMIQQSLLNLKLHDPEFEIGRLVKNTSDSPTELTETQLSKNSAN